MDVTFCHLFLTMYVLKHFNILHNICLWICVINVNVVSKYLLLVGGISSDIVQLYERMCFLSLSLCSIGLWIL